MRRNLSTLLLLCATLDATAEISSDEACADSHADAKEAHSHWHILMDTVAEVVAAPADGVDDLLLDYDGKILRDAQVCLQQQPEPMSRACFQLRDSATDGFEQCASVNRTAAFAQTEELHPLLRQLRDDLIACSTGQIVTMVDWPSVEYGQPSGDTLSLAESALRTCGFVHLRGVLPSDLMGRIDRQARELLADRDRFFRYYSELPKDETDPHRKPRPSLHGAEANLRAGRFTLVPPAQGPALEAIGRLAQRSGGVRKLLERVWGVDSAAVELIYASIIGQHNDSASAAHQIPCLASPWEVEHEYDIVLRDPIGSISLSL